MDRPGRALNLKIVRRDLSQGPKPGRRAANQALAPARFEVAAGRSTSPPGSALAQECRSPVLRSETSGQPAGSKLREWVPKVPDAEVERAMRLAPGPT